MSLVWFLTEWARRAALRLVGPGRPVGIWTNLAGTLDDNHATCRRLSRSSSWKHRKGGRQRRWRWWSWGKCYGVKHAPCMRCAKHVDVFSGEHLVPSKPFRRNRRGRRGFPRWTSVRGCCSVVLPWPNPPPSIPPSPVSRCAPGLCARATFWWRARTFPSSTSIITCTSARTG